MSGYFDFLKKPVRMPISPYDRSTVVSICPFPIHEVKPTIFPGYFDFPEAKENDFELLVVGPSSWFKDLGPGQSPIEIQESSYIIAKSIVQDYLAGIFGCNMTDRKPGLFFIPGKHDKLTVQTFKDETGKTFKEYIDEARIKQLNWLTAVVDETDALFARTNGNPKVVGRDALIAAKYLNIKREWADGIRAAEHSACPACGNRINKAYPICQFCKVIINPELARELNLQFAS